MNAFPHAPVIGLLVAVFVLILLVLRTRVHPLIAMIAAGCIAGLLGGMSVEQTLEAITRGFGNTLASIGIVIGLGVMMGRVLEISGAATQIADSFIRLLGKGREAVALAMTGYFVSIPIFVDSAFIILFPVAKALGRKSKRSILSLGVALAGGLVVTHTTVPPTPGPLAAAGIFGVDVGAMMLLGMALAIPCVLAILAYTLWLEKRYPGFNNTFVPTEEGEAGGNNDAANRAPLPGLLRSWLPIAVPITLIFAKALLGIFPAIPAGSHGVVKLMADLVYLAGTPLIALSISTLLAVYTLLPYLDKNKTNQVLEDGLQAAGIILLVTGAGGALGTVVRDSGAGNILATQISTLPFSPIMIPFFVATAIRLIQGSGTVACITSASITAPILSQVPDINMLIAAQSAVMGALCFSYFNDSLFWVVNRMMGITDARHQMMVWSVPTTIAWAVGGTMVAVVNLAFGSGGTVLDIALPLACSLGLWLALRSKMQSTVAKKEEDL
jgi:gluconate:H+ symporter, GntP family